PRRNRGTEAQPGCGACPTWDSREPCGESSHGSRDRSAGARRREFAISNASRAESPCDARQGQWRVERSASWTASPSRGVKGRPKRVDPAGTLSGEELIAAAPPTAAVGRHSRG